MNNSLKYFSRYLDTNGDGTGTKNAKGDYSSTVTDFYIKPGPLETFDVLRMIVTVEDGGGGTVSEYGNLGAALTNGISVGIYQDNSLVIDLCDGIPITANAQWGSTCYDVSLKTWGNGNDLLLVRWTFVNDFGNRGIILNGTNGDELRVRCNDNLGGLVGHYFMVKGTRLRKLG